MGINLTKVQEKAPGLVNLVKEADNALVRQGLQGEVARVALCLDFSGSMRSRYSRGEVQDIAERALAIATQFDDDGSIDVFAFDSGADHIGELNLDNYKGGVDRLLANRRMGSTNYAGAFREVNKHFGFDGSAPKKGLFGGMKKTASAGGPVVPVYTIFLTDGAPDSKTDAENVLRDISGNGIFWKFLSVGRESIPFLEKLDDLKNRVIDNADYQPVGEPSQLDDTRLFDLLLVEYKDWLREARAKGMIV